MGEKGKLNTLYLHQHLEKYLIIYFFINLLFCHGCKTELLKDWVNKSSDYISIEELYHYCNAPSPCGKKTDCEGKVARVKGYIDYQNVFDKKNYPQLPYEKFKIYDEEGKSLEVWAVSPDNSKIFEKIYRNKSFPGKMAFVRGIMIGFDMPIMGACHRGIKIEIEKADDIFFGG